MVSAVRRGASMRSVARRFSVSLRTVQRWVERAGSRRLDRVDFGNRPSGCRPASNRVAAHVEELIVQTRQDLKHHSDLGEFGALAILRELQGRPLPKVPSVRTIGRVLDRRGALDGQRRHRRPAPPKGWYLPDVIAGQAELDGFDLIEDLRIQEGPLVDVLTGVSLHGGLAVAWPMEAQATAQAVLAAIPQHWRSFGLPHYGQFDNDTRFQGAHHHRDVIGRVSRMCLGLGVVPVFTPPRETGFQAAIENLNGRWQVSVWSRFHHDSLGALSERSDNYIAALRRRRADRIDAAPARRPFPKHWTLDLQTRPRGCIVYLRRTTDKGAVSLLGHTFEVDRHWPHRLVRCEVDLDNNLIRFFALRRRAPSWQPLLTQTSHRIPSRKFHE